MDSRNNKENNKNILNIPSTEDSSSGDSSNGDESSVEAIEQFLTGQFLEEIRDYLNIRQENIHTSINA